MRQRDEWGPADEMASDFANIGCFLVLPLLLLILALIFFT